MQYFPHSTVHTYILDIEVSCFDTRINAFYPLSRCWLYASNVMLQKQLVLVASVLFHIFWDRGGGEGGVAGQLFQGYLDSCYLFMTHSVHWWAHHASHFRFSELLALAEDIQEFGRNNTRVLRAVPSRRASSAAGQLHSKVSLPPTASPPKKNKPEKIDSDSETSSSDVSIALELAFWAMGHVPYANSKCWPLIDWDFLYLYFNARWWYLLDD